jgi:hypothetical protein
MNIYIEQDAALVADLLGCSRPACDGVILKFGDPREVLATTMRGNPLGGAWLLDVELPGSRAVAWSGTVADELFAADPMTWMKPGQTAFADFCDQIAPQLLRHERTLCFQPHARHVLSDAHSCLRFMRERREGPFEVAFAPATMLERSMLSDLDDHLRRMFELLAGSTEATDVGPAMLVMHDVALAQDSDEQPLMPVALGDGVLPRDLVRGLVDEYLSPELPIVLRPEWLDQQLAWLGA